MVVQSSLQGSWMSCQRRARQVTLHFLARVFTQMIITDARLFTWCCQEVAREESQLFRLLGQPLTATPGSAWQPGGSASLQRAPDANSGGVQEAFRPPGFRLQLGVQALRFLVALAEVRCAQQTRYNGTGLGRYAVSWAQKDTAAKHRM